jgi:hypothetical protein
MEDDSGTKRQAPETFGVTHTRGLACVGGPSFHELGDNILAAVELADMTVQRRELLVE